jgi:urease beta subunit
MRSGGSTQAPSVLATSADDRPLQVPGCFHLVRDSLSRSFAFPERFSLESPADSGAPRNIMRAVAEDGRRDSVIAGVTWRFTPGTSRVLLIGSEPSAAPASSFKSRATIATERVVGGAAYLSSARLTRIDCR